MRDTLFTLNDGTVREHLRKAEVAIGVLRQNLEIYATPETAKASLALLQVGISGITAKIHKDRRGHRADAVAGRAIVTLASWFARVVHALTPSRSAFPDEATLSRGRMRIDRERAEQAAALKAAKRGPWAPAVTVRTGKARRSKKVLPMRTRTKG